MGPDGGSRRRTVVVAGLLALSGAVGLGACSEGPGGQEVPVAIRTFAYDPAEVTVEEGDRVVWMNEDIVPHTVTAADGSWDSGTLAPGESWSWTPSDGATSEYTCTLHPTMVGRVVLQ